jgi:hypothetical protein
MAQRKKSGWGGYRKGAGRKPSFRDPIDRLVRFEKADVKAAEALARKQETAFAEIVRVALRHFLEQQGGER